MAVYVRTGNFTTMVDNTSIETLLDGDDLIVGKDATLIAAGLNSEVVNATTNSDMSIDGEMLSAERVIVTTGGGHDISIGLDGAIRSLNGFDAIVLNGAGGNRVFNAGEISGGGGAIEIAGDGNELTNTGVISGQTLEVVDFLGSSNTLINHGTIAGVANDAVFMGGTGGHYLFNSGFISGVNDDAVQLNGSLGQINTLVNTGTITTENLAAFAINGASADEFITNSGLLNGRVALDAGNDRFDTRLGTVLGEVFGGSGNDTMWGSSQDDRFFGGADNDTLHGFAGDDLLDGGTGDDVLRGGAGEDELVGGAGLDTASYAKAAAGLTASLADADLNTGEAAGDTYSGIEGLIGSSFSDTLSGDGAANTILGGSGGDLINGSLGLDILTGGSGADKFVFTTKLGATNVDQVTDFTVKVDKIHLENAFFKGLANGGLTAAAFRVGSAAGDASDRIIYNKSTGAVLYDKDGKGGAAAVKFAELDPNLALKATDFFVI